MDIDKIFQEEIENHNFLIETSSKLQELFAKVTIFGFSTSDSISLLIECIQKKDYDTARTLVQDTVYSISSFADKLISAVETLNMGVSGKYDKEADRYKRN